MCRRKKIVCEKNSDLRKVTRTWAHPMIVFALWGIASLVFFAILADGLPALKGFFHRIANCILQNIFGQRILCFVWNVKGALIENSDAFCNLVMTFATILGAAVTFFYSVQDNKKEGISHRTIIAYSAGSFGIPVLFILTLVLVPVSYIAMSLGAYWTTFICLFWGYVVDVTIIGLILLATSFQFSVHTLGNVEIRQFKAMNQLWIKYRENKKSGKINAEADYFYAWTYVPHHMEELMKSEELISDKLVLVRRLLRVPFIKKEIPLLKEFSFFDRKKKCLELQTENLESNQRSRTYEYYYSNLLAVFNQIKKQESDVRDKVYLVLYEFIDEMTSFYNKSARNCCYRRNKYRDNYLMTLCGIMNAIMFSGIQEAQQFCEHVLYKISYCQKEDCVDIDKVFTKLLGLTCIYRDVVRQLRDIQNETDENVHKNIAEPNYNTQHLIVDTDVQFYEGFWKDWMDYTTLMQNISNNYLADAILNKNIYIDILLRKREEQDENTINSADEQLL